MEDVIEVWKTKGGRYELKLVEDNFGYKIESYKNKTHRGTRNLGEKSLEDAKSLIREKVHNTKAIDGINYKNCMKTIKSKTGNKKVTIKKGKDGYGDVVFRASLTQSFDNGIEIEERFIELKETNTEKKAVNWAKRKLA